MNILTKRRWKKAITHTLNEAKHARDMREDLTDQKLLDESIRREQLLSTLWKKGGGEEELTEAVEGVQEIAEKIFPSQPHASSRELVEVVVVALIVAMGLRAYFIQPFKIPTGSMQPTLNGILYEPTSKPANVFDKFLPTRFVKYLATGKSFKTWEADGNGVVTRIQEDLSNNRLFVEWVGRMPTILPSRKVQLHVKAGDRVKSGDPIATAWKMAGDHIFVDKIRYNFIKPKLGQVFVFNTLGISHPEIKENNFYIKRITGVPGDTVSIQPPNLVRNGKVEDETDSLLRVMSAEDGYHGYVYSQDPRRVKTPSILYHPEGTISMKEHEYLPFGDNSPNSLDGRYFGPVHFKHVVGPAFFVYWPFKDHWGMIQ